MLSRDAVMGAVRGGPSLPPLLDCLGEHRMNKPQVYSSAKERRVMGMEKILP